MFPIQIRFFGKPRIKGTRIGVELVLDLMASGWSEALILESYPHLKVEDLQAVFAFVRDCLKDKAYSCARRFSRRELPRDEIRIQPMVIGDALATALRALAEVPDGCIAVVTRDEIRLRPLAVRDSSG